jgi:hypothetical protein
MRLTLCVQIDKGLFNVGIDPGFVPAMRGLRAMGDNLGKGSIGGHLKTILPDSLRQRL